MAEYKGYPEYKDSGVDWLGNIPSGWGLRRLDHVSDITLGKMVQREPTGQDDVEIPYIRAANIQSDSSINLGISKTMWFSPREINKLAINKNDILVVEGGSVGRSHYVTKNIKGHGFEKSINRIRSISNYSVARFIFYFMNTVKASGYLDAYCNAVSFPHLTTEKLSALKIPMPSLETQQEIVEFLDRETTHIDAGIANMESLVALLTEKRSALISGTVTRGIPGEHTEFKDSGVEWLGEIPVEWDVSQVRDFFTERRERNDLGQKANYLSLMANRGIIPYAEKGNIGNKMPEDLSKTKKVLAGDFVINSMNYGIGSFGDSAYDGVCSSVYVVLTPHPEVYDKFAYLLLSNMDVARYAQSFGKGILAHRCAIGWDILKGLGMPLPPLDTQQKIVEFLAEETKHIDLAISNAKSVIHLMKEKRQTLISDAVTGKIDVRNSAN